MATRFQFKLTIETKTQVGELIFSYQQLQEIHRMIRPHNAKASTLFPQFKIWAPYVSQPKASDMEKFRQV
jgi:hypothetical protein